MKNGWLNLFCGIFCMLVIINVLLGVWFKIVCLVLVMVDLDVFRMVIVKGGVCGYNVN